MSVGVAGQRRPPAEPTRVAGGRRRGRRGRSSARVGGRRRHGRLVDEAERGGEALPLPGGVRRQLDGKALPGGRDRLGVARAAEDGQDVEVGVLVVHQRPQDAE